MRPVIPAGYTRVLGRSQGFIGLPVKDAVMECDVGGPVETMTSEWELSPQDIAEIVEGGRIRITLQGTAHPPILVSICDPMEALQVL